MGILIDELWNKYGRLTVISYAGKGKENRAMWNCYCECGNKLTVSGKSLRTGNTKSCGCLSVDLSTDRIVKHNTKHGKTHDPLYTRWSSMLTRCENPNAINYHDYGGRGVKVCAEWHEFQPFYDWAMRSGYKPTLTIDRIDPNGDYAPNNCRWADAKTQAENRRSTRMLTFNGETHCLAEWARLFKIDPTNLQGQPDNEIIGKLAEYARRRL